MSRVAIVSTCAMKQRAMDFPGNLERIVESVRKAKEMGSKYRSGSELEITGYGCGDHFLEADTQRHAWEAVAELLQHEVCSSGIMVDVGLPVQHNNVVYNCRLAFLNRKVLLIRPKMMMADTSKLGYQETRWFTNWQKVREVEDHQLPPCITKVTGQRSVPFGDALLVTRDTTIGIEVCEELWNSASPNVGMYLAGAEIICNGAGSHQEVGYPGGWDVTKNTTTRSGGCYLLGNQKGCDGSLGNYPGESYIAVNGKLLCEAPLHTLSEVDVLTAVVDLDDVLTYKNEIRSRSRCAAAAPAYPRVQVDFTLCQEENDEGREGKDKPKEGNVIRPLTLPIEPRLPPAAEQVLEGMACWLWDFLCRSQRHGLLLQLCGEVSDTATAAIVFAMCHKVMETVPLDAQVKANLLRVTGGTLPKNVHELCGRLLVTFSGKLSVDNRAAAIAQQIGSEHVTPEMEGDAVLEAVRSAQEVTVAAGGRQGDVSTYALQHLHAFRARLLVLRAARGEMGRGGARQLLVLATTPGGDMPEAIRGTRKPLSGSGHFGDVSVVGYIPKGILREVLLLAKERYNLPVLDEVLTEVTEEIQDKKTKEDKKEEVMEEMDWAEMWALNRTQHKGPRAMFLTLVRRWRGTHSPAQVARCVQTFFTAQGARSFIPPGAHSCYVVCSGSQHPARPLLTPEALTWQFKAINDEVKKLERKGYQQHQQQQQQQ